MHPCTPTHDIAVTRALEDLFLEHLEQDGTCWRWRGNPRGVVLELPTGRTTISPLRVAWAITQRRPLAAHERVHVTCAHKAPASGYAGVCCNPDHLDADDDSRMSAHALLDNAFGDIWRI